MKRFQKFLAIAAIAGAFSFPAVSEALAAYATGSVNLRAGPGTGYHRIATVPAGAYLRVHNCVRSGWCHVSYGRANGWMSGRYISHGPSYGPRYPYRPYPYYHRPLPPPGFGIWLGW